MENDQYMTPAVRDYGEYSEDEVDVFREFITRDNVVIEVGANMGLHTMALAGLARHVVAFEPQPFIYYVLAANLALNSIPNVLALMAACGEETTTVPVPILDPYRLQNFGGVEIKPAPSPNGAIALPCHAIDDLDLPSNITFIKLDCEGQELASLMGAKQLLADQHPTIYAEFTSHRSELLALLRGLGYFCYRHIPNHTRASNFLQTPMPARSFASDMLLASATPLTQPQVDNLQLYKPTTQDVLNVLTTNTSNI